MATKVCPNCGAEYIAKATTCVDCGVELVAGDDVDPAAVGEPERTGDQIAYELGDWSPQSRTLLDQLLVGESVPHVWESGTLVVDAASETRTDRLVDQVEVSEQPMLDPDADRIVYDLAGWSEDRRSALGEALTDDGIAHGWDGDDNLVIVADDQDQADAVVDRVDAADLIDVDPEADGEPAADAAGAADAATDDDGDEDEDGEEGDDDEGGAEDPDLPDAESVMSDLFVASDRLMHRPKDAADRAVLTAAADAAERLDLPYGLPRPIWDDLVARAGELRDLVADQPIDEDAVIEAAKAVRAHLRDYV